MEMDLQSLFEFSQGCHCPGRLSDHQSTVNSLSCCIYYPLWAERWEIAGRAARDSIVDEMGGWMR